MFGFGEQIKSHSNFISFTAFQGMFANISCNDSKSSVIMSSYNVLVCIDTTLLEITQQSVNMHIGRISMAGRAGGKLPHERTLST
jgi:hypothetical protein